MKFFTVIPAVLAACSAEAQLPIARNYLGTAGLYNGVYGPSLPYASAYGSYIDAKFAYGAPITALNAGPLTPAPVSAGAPFDTAAPSPVVAAYSAGPAFPTARYASSYSAPLASVAYGTTNAAPVAAVAAAPVAGPVSSQFQAQDELGNIAYGYNNINSAKQERGNANGGVTGSYTYQDEAGVHTVNYVADDFGFRVVGDNVPVNFGASPVAPVTYGAAPAVSAVAPATYAAAPALSAVAPATYAAAPALSAVAPATYAAAPALSAAIPATYAATPALTAVAPAALAAAPTREAIKTTIKLNPGHAIFYRVD